MITCEISITAGQLWKQELCPPLFFPSNLLQPTFFIWGPTTTAGFRGGTQPVQTSHKPINIRGLQPVSPAIPNTLFWLHTTLCPTSACCCILYMLQSRSSADCKMQWQQKKILLRKIIHMYICRTWSYTVHAVAKNEIKSVKNMNLYKHA